jgi:hypothetical protein
MFSKAEIIILLAQLNHGSLDATVRVYKDERKHGGLVVQQIV